MGLGPSEDGTQQELEFGKANQDQGGRTTEGTERSSLQEVLGTHSAEQGAERPEVLHRVDWVGQTGQLADDRTSAAVLKMAVGMGLDA